MKRFRVIGGFALIVAGVLGVMLPIIPGTPLLIAGVALVGTDHPKIQFFVRWIERFTKRKLFQPKDEKPGESEVVAPDTNDRA
ncbi:MAG TPA: hypothetical protein VFV34_18595 [Blastocatellia bacterium]|nr:hypothetical protein [Blastocatellia bacterium]